MKRWIILHTDGRVNSTQSVPLRGGSAWGLEKICSLPELDECTPGFPPKALFGEEWGLYASIGHGHLLVWIRKMSDDQDANTFDRTSPQPQDAWMMAPS